MFLFFRQSSNNNFYYVTEFNLSQPWVKIVSIMLWSLDDVNNLVKHLLIIMNCYAEYHWVTETI